MLYHLFYFSRIYLLGCVPQVVCAYETVCSTMKRLIIGVNVKEDLGKGILLITASATLVVQFHIKSPVGQYILDKYIKSTVFCCVVEFLDK